MRNRQEIFEKIPVPRAVFTLAIPTILSQLVNIVYHLTDTFFIGLLNDPFQTAAVNLVFPLFFMFIVFANLFGMGAGSLISRLLGKKDFRQIKHVASLSFFLVILSALVYVVLVFLFLDPILIFMGASGNTLGYAKDYVMWSVVVGGIPTALSMTIGSLLRSEGFSKQASIGFAIGTFANILLDPLFMFGLNLQIAGAAIATMLANVIALSYYLWVSRSLKKQLHIRFQWRFFRPRKIWIYSILAVGIPSATAALFNMISIGLINNLTVAYGDIPLAAIGIVKKIDMVPLAISIGITQGIIPLVGYNYAAKNYRRMRAISHFGMACILIFSLSCVVLFNLAPALIFQTFMREPQTLAYGTQFLRIAVLATPIMGINFVINTSFQAMGKGKQSMLLSISRQGLINIPLLFLMNHWFGLLGIVWTQLVSDLITFILGYILYAITTHKLHLEEKQHNLLNTSG